MKSMDSKSNPTLTLTLTLTPPPPRRASSMTPSSISCSSSSSSSSSSPSPFHRLLPSSSIPFSWERHPGIPKSPSSAAPSAGRNPLLPPPPPLRSLSSTSHRKRSFADDPFAAALLECAKDAPPAHAIWWRRLNGSGPPGGKMASWISRRTILADRVSFLDLFASLSCKTSCSVSDGSIVVPRSRVRAPGEYGVLERRA